MRRLLLFGATGFLGGHVLRQAEAAGVAVVSASRSAPARSPAHHQIDLATAGPARIATLITSVAPDAVVNCAGAVAGDPDVLAAANVTATWGLVTAMLSRGIQTRLVHVGSAAEYGRSEPGVPVTESAPARPAGVYGVTKLAGTRLVELGRTAGLDAVVLRVFNPVGAGAPESSLPGRVAAQVRRALADGSDIQLGPLDAVRDFVDARDVADAVLAAAARPVLRHAVINVGSGCGVPARTLVRGLLTVSHCAAAVHEDAPGSARSGQLLWQQADITRAREELGWRPRRDLAAALSDLWEAGRGPDGR
jgi:nucleoside-diphosphate-sugar epimerase